MNRKILYIIGSLMITFSLSACDYFGDDDSDGPASGYLSIEAWDLTPSQKLIVWVYPDDTAFTSMYGDGMFSILIAQGEISLNTYGEGMTVAVYPNTGEAVSLSGWYALLAFVDTNGNGEPDTGEIYAMKDVSVDGNTDVSFDDYEFGYTIP